MYWKKKNRSNYQAIFTQQKTQKPISIVFYLYALKEDFVWGPLGSESTNRARGTPFEQNCSALFTTTAYEIDPYPQSNTSSIIHQRERNGTEGKVGIWLRMDNQLTETRIKLRAESGGERRGQRSDRTDATRSLIHKCPENDRTRTALRK